MTAPIIVSVTHSIIVLIDYNVSHELFCESVSIDFFHTREKKILYEIFLFENEVAFEYPGATYKLQQEL